MKTTKLLICTVGFAAALAAAKAQGQNISATLEGMTIVAGVHGTIDNGLTIEERPSGILNFTDFGAFCVEPAQSIAFGETLVYQIQDPSSLAGYETIARLVGGYLSSSRTARDAAAVQWAIWEITTETFSGSPSLLDGNVRLTSGPNEDIALLANQYLANASGYDPATISYLTSGNSQDVVTWQMIPEPGTAGLAALSALAFFRRRR